jgi:lipase maturation factor 1
VVLEGSLDGVTWREYQFRCKPGDVMRRPCVISPLQPRLDWQIWFAAMSRPEYQGWLFKLVGRLLEGDQAVLSLMAPFDFTPRVIRARLYEYRFTRWGEPGWWTRSLVGEYFPPLDKEQVRQIAAEDF